MAEEGATTVEAISSPQPVESIEVDAVVKDEDADNTDDVKEEDSAMDVDKDGPKVTTEQYKALKFICDALYNFKVKRKGDDEWYPSTLFRRIPNKRILPDYYNTIKTPAAISTLKQKIQTKKYTGIPEFVKDFAQVVWNAQIYNRPNSQPVRDVLLLKGVFEEEMKKLVDEGLVKEEEIVFPDLGPIPEATPEPDPVSEEEEEEDAEDEVDEEDEEEEDVDESDDDKRKRRARRGGRTSLAGRKHPRDEDDEVEKGNEDSRKRRGRPPKVDTPDEARIRAVLKGIRKPKDDEGNLRIRHFEKIPDKQLFPHYFQEIKEPIALDVIKKKLKRKKYNSVDQFGQDIDLMFKNAMEYNEDASDIYKDAVDLQAEANQLLAAEKAKPDEDYLMEDGRYPLPDGILYKNEIWKVGDWVHILNPNDVTKPIVAQIYRTWQDSDNQKWVNACWYYRPEQTVHQYEKHFYPNEVVKTGQYRDHEIEEIIDRCFVMFFTRYSRGRPKNIGNQEVYVCEARYNEEKHRMNKIKTWASCLPDEVRDKDYEWVSFDVPRKIKKVPSPLLHLLKDDAKETDGLPQPEWGHANAPPRVGAIHRQPRDENQSPPPEPTPPPPPTPPPQPARVQQPAMMPHPQPRPSVESQAGTNTNRSHPMMSPSVTPQLPSYQTSTNPSIPSYGRQSSYQTPGASNQYASGMPQTPIQNHAGSYTAQQQLHPPPSLAAAHPTSYTGATPSQNYARPSLAPAQGSQYPQQNTNLPSIRAPDVFVLRDTANNALPQHIRDQFPQDDQGRVLFFTTPPKDTRHFIEGRSEGDKGKPLIHSASYLATKPEAEMKPRSNQQAISKDSTNEDRESDGRFKADPTKAVEIAASMKKQEELEEKAHSQRSQDVLGRALKLWTKKMDEGTKNFYKSMYGDRWETYMLSDHVKREEETQKEKEKRKAREELMKTMIQEPEYMTQVHKDPWSSTYLDDYDPRYGF